MYSPWIHYASSCLICFRKRGLCTSCPEGRTSINNVIPAIKLAQAPLRTLKVYRNNFTSGKKSVNWKSLSRDLYWKKILNFVSFFILSLINHFNDFFKRNIIRRELGKLLLIFWSSKKSVNWKSLSRDLYWKHILNFVFSFYFILNESNK